MNDISKLVKIIIVVNKQLSPAITEALNKAGITKIYFETGRTSIIEESEGFLTILNSKKLGNDPVEILTIFIENKYEDILLNYISSKFDFKTPGKGTVFSNVVHFVRAHKMCKANSFSDNSVEKNSYMFTELKGICCIAQRGEGDRIAKISLESGASVPVTTYGTGSGVRDKLGLLRITIPAEKELVNLIMSKFDIDSLMELVIVEGKLEEPGRGITYVYPVKQGIVNTKISRGKTGQAASMEQVVSAIDSIKGGMEWRKSRLESESSKKRFFLTNLMELTLICNDGYGTFLTKAAMESGAAGATICKMKYRTKAEDDKIPVMREMCKMIVSPDKVSAIADAIEQTGGFSDEMHGLLYSLPVPKAFTYISRKS